ncbi:MAG: peptide ABC transporter substrate-binding protein [Candidatus Kerfeldbacteria bacterium]|nr:peptide ABC transporter substrate-binding protein [Candidatus Kerfeldbacteria bacterium]
MLYGRGEQTVEATFRQANLKSWPSGRQFSLLFRIMSRQERRVGLSLLALCFITAVSLTGRWLERQTVSIPQAGGEYTEGIIGLPRTANPLLAATAADLDLSYLTSRGLIQSGDQGTFIPDLAEAWTVSQDQKTYELKLRPNLHWSDGQPLTNDDVIFTFRSLQDKKLASPWATSFRGVDITSQDNGLIKFSLSEPYAPFLSALTVGIIPTHIWQNIPLPQWLLAETNLKPVGTGPYRFKSLTHTPNGQLISYTLEENPFTHTDKPLLKKIILRFYPNQEEAWAALRESSIEGLGGLTPTGLATASLKHFTAYELALPQYTAIFYNPQRQTLLQNQNVRQGLSYAVNRAQLIQSGLRGAARPATGPFTFGEVKRRTSADAITFDATRAATLFSTAGFSLNQNDKYYAKAGQTLELTLTSLDNDEQITIAQIIKQQWEAAGVKVNLETIPAYRLQRDIITPRHYQALLASEVIGTDPDPYPFWHSSQIAPPGLNLAQFQNPEADRLLAEARQTADLETRLEKYSRFQKILQIESPATFLYSTNYTYLLNNDLQGLTATSINQPSDRFRQIANWYRQTKRQWK